MSDFHHDNFLRALCVAAPHMSRALRVVVPCALLVLVPYVPSYLTRPTFSRALCFICSRALSVSCSTCLRCFVLYISSCLTRFVPYVPSFPMPFRDSCFISSFSLLTPSVSYLTFSMFQYHPLRSWVSMPHAPIILFIVHFWFFWGIYLSQNKYNLSVILWWDDQH